jgi:hypothetical protein
MTHLSEEEAEAFYLASLREFDLGSIGDHGFWDRMRSLADMLPDQLAALLRQEMGLDDRRSFGEQDEDNGAEASINALEDGGNAGNRGASSPPVLELVVQNVRGMSRWHFRKTDPDHFPSVPHGHEDNLDWPVCDPYTGRVYDGDREELQNGRLSRKTRIALWKDAKFRAFALAAIMYHENAFPYRPIRVRRPHRLPTIFRH